ncbi:hypothetical protein XNC1_0737 [Xenorhabdus nematophila ATCC 19061]|uniref:Uncharacterized protein n=1 Tax=Xenorhabdus nematophila (strain ATCC 19061 / DSM 3370 / CCUG 14189 / LMG 1036 / NCIMB 9965 / AN6) TaxID=406817 RepID=D3VK56_XENNA|nr:hypothetical protein XNC1_0737 [Xenorhabdus nematophila ATCC 19061]CEK21723.1 hypothetical protein XNC2_0727 [Xenorhabdus nematophila AN6/1]
MAETTGSRPRLNRLGVLNLHRIEDTVLREDPGINAENIAYFAGARRETDPLSQKSLLFWIMRVTPGQNA